MTFADSVEIGVCEERDRPQKIGPITRRPKRVLPVPQRRHPAPGEGGVKSLARGRRCLAGSEQPDLESKSPLQGPCDRIPSAGFPRQAHGRGGMPAHTASTLGLVLGRFGQFASVSMAVGPSNARPPPLVWGSKVTAPARNTRIQDRAVWLGGSPVVSLGDAARHPVHCPGFHGLHQPGGGRYLDVPLGRQGARTAQYAAARRLPHALKQPLGSARREVR